ncbi:MAG: pirin family protein [Microthrixaceae bacterium]
MKADAKRDAATHPHSGIATVSVVLDGAVQYAETTGSKGVLRAGSVEWMRAGGGVWHTGSCASWAGARLPALGRTPRIPRECANQSRYLDPADVPEAGPVRVILGSYQGLRSLIDSPPMTHLVVTLRDGERWSYQPPAGHDVAWVAISQGALDASLGITHGEVAVFENGESEISFVADGNTQFVLGSAPRHPHPLVLGNYSVHTSGAALQQGEAEIRRIGAELRDSGKNSYALAQLEPERELPFNRKTRS